MKFKSWYPAVAGEKRITTWFALIPVKIGTDVRWMERVTVEWQVAAGYDFLPPCSPRWKWIKVRFVD